MIIDDFETQLYKVIQSQFKLKIPKGNIDFTTVPDPLQANIYKVIMGVLKPDHSTVLEYSYYVTDLTEETASKLAADCCNQLTVLLKSGMRWHFCTKQPITRICPACGKVVDTWQVDTDVWAVGCENHECPVRPIEYGKTLEIANHMFDGRANDLLRMKQAVLEGKIH